MKPGKKFHNRLQARAGIEKFGGWDVCWDRIYTYCYKGRWLGFRYYSVKMIAEGLSLPELLVKSLCEEMYQQKALGRKWLRNGPGEYAFGRRRRYRRQLKIYFPDLGKNQGKIPKPG